MADEMNQIMAGIALGYDVEAFLESRLGKYLTERAQADAIDAMAELKVVSAYDTESITKLQNLIHRAESFEGWLIEAMQQGRALETQLELANTED